MTSPREVDNRASSVRKASRGVGRLGAGRLTAHRLRGIADLPSRGDHTGNPLTSNRQALKSSAPAVAVMGTRGYPSYYGGFETAVRRIAPELVDRGWRVRVYGRRTAVRTNDPAIDRRVTSVLTPGLDTNALSTLSYGFTATLHMMLRKPDVALVMNVANGFWLPLLRVRGIRTIVNVDGIEWERDKWSRLGKTVFHWSARFTARFADELVFDAVAIGDYWRRQFGREGVFIPYGGDPTMETSTGGEFQSGRYVLVVARFVPENSLAQFLAAAESLVERWDLDVVLVGSAPADDPLQAAAEALAATNPRVHLLGHISDDRRLFGLWRHAGVYFHGHTVGGTNPALVQAMTLGARIVARDTVYNREVLGDTGHFCDGTPESIVVTVGAALSDPRSLGDLARDRAAEHYSWDQVSGSYADVLAAQLGPRSVRQLD